jgi:hypothetical protein
MLDFNECEESGQLVAYSDNCSYWITEGNDKSHHELQVIRNDSGECMLSAKSKCGIELEGTAHLINGWLSGAGIAVRLDSESKLWGCLDLCGDGIAHGTSPVFAIQRWQRGEWSGTGRRHDG